MSAFSGIKDAKLFERGRFFAPNFAGVVEVERTISKNALRAGPSFIVEVRVLESNKPDEHPVGSKGTWFQKLTDKVVAFPSIKGWAAAVLGYETPKEVEEELSPILEDVLDSAVKNPDSSDPKLNPFVGRKVALVTTQVKTQRGLDFTRHDWSAV
jgi:hypothetical protein